MTVVGASGVQALVMVLLLQFAALMRLDAMAPAVLILAAVAGRLPALGNGALPLPA